MTITESKTVANDKVCETAIETKWASLGPAFSKRQGEMVK